MRQPAEPQAAIRSLALDLAPGYALDPHAHAWPQLVHARSGVVALETEGGSYVVPPSRAVWVPAGERHALRAVGALRLRTLYVRPDRAVELVERCRVVAVPGLLRELIDHAIGLGPLFEHRPEHAPVIALLCDRMRALEDQPLELPWPRDPRARRVAAAIDADPGRRVDLDTLAQGSGAGRRTLERVFRRETGVGLGRWRQQRRLFAALERLAAGEPVTSVALEVGYSSSSAFVAAFRTSFGTTPGSYFERR